MEELHAAQRALQREKVLERQAQRKFEMRERLYAVKQERIRLKEKTKALQAEKLVKMKERMRSAGVGSVFKPEASQNGPGDGLKQ